MGFRTIQVKDKNGAIYPCEDRQYRDKERGYSTHKRRFIVNQDRDGKPSFRAA